MPFNTLLLSGCLLPGETSFGESGGKVRIQPKSGETVLFFSIDDQSNSNCGFRQILGINQENMKICDLIIFYANNNQRIICFVELKGSDLKTAVQQVINTYESFRRYLASSKQKNNLIDCTAKAYVKFNGSVPQELDKYKKELNKVFGEHNFDLSRNEDLGDFIRGLAQQPKGKRKNR